MSCTTYASIQGNAVNVQTVMCHHVFVFFMSHKQKNTGIKPLVIDKQLAVVNIVTQYEEIKPQS